MEAADSLATTMKMKLLFEYAFNPVQSSLIVEQTKATITGPVEWDRSIANTIPPLLQGVWIAVKRQAVAWIDANQPDHPARSRLLEA
jgi:hypothetical protein